MNTVSTNKKVTTSTTILKNPNINSNFDYFYIKNQKKGMKIDTLHAIFSNLWKIDKDYARFQKQN